MNNTKFLFLGLLLTGCSGVLEDAAGLSAEYADPATEITTVLQFVPSTEGEYGRQEALYLRSGSHYRLEKQINFEGTVAAYNDDRISGKVRFTGAQPGGAPDGASIRQKEFDAIDGSFIARLVPGDYLVDIIPNRADIPAQRFPIVVEKTTRDLGLVAAAGALVEGTVRDASGTPVPGVSVRVLSSDGSYHSQSVLTQGTAGSEGKFSVAVGPDLSKTYRLEFAGPEKYLPRVIFDLSVTEPTGALPSKPLPKVTFDIQYEPKVDTVVAGKVVSAANGEPAADVTVVFSAKVPQAFVAARSTTNNQANTSAEAVFVTKTDASGNFSLTVPRGDWNYTFSLQPPLDREYGGLTITPYTFPSGSQVFSLKGKTPVVGRVIEPGGAPVFAEVVISKTFSFVDSQQVLRVFTNATGEFQAALDGSVDAYDVTVLPLDGVHARCTRSVVPVQGFQESFFVHPGEKSTGFAEDRDGNPLSRVAVTLVGRAASQSTPVRILAESEALTDSEGYFELLVPTDPTLTGCRGAQLSPKR